ncbi:MAG: histidinol-phosphate transaminase [Rhizobiales bacterium]|nr:histidinol-phosphate transaminase [Hyphomicrobiales bacterium]
MVGPVPKAGILEIDPYVPGESGGPDAIKLSANENPLGPSPAAVAAYHAGEGTLARYPDGSARALRSAIASAYGLHPDRIVCGAGSDELLNLIAHAYLGPGDEAIHTAHGFLVYRIATLANGARPVVAPESELHCDVDAILERVTPRTRVVFLANPNNPTGTYIPVSEVRRLRAGLPEGVLLVLDAAYAEYVERNDYEAGIELVATTPDTVMTRTFSKIHGLASLRLGWAYCPPGVADVLNRIRGPFNISAAAIAAGIAAIGDREHVARSLRSNAEAMATLVSGLDALGIRSTPSVGNFLLAHFDPAGGRTAAAADAHLRADGIYVRRVAGYGLPDALRITVGLAAENAALLASLARFARAAPGDRS